MPSQMARLPGSFRRRATSLAIAERRKAAIEATALLAQLLAGQLDEETHQRRLAERRLAHFGACALERGKERRKPARRTGQREHELVGLGLHDLDARFGGHRL